MPKAPDLDAELDAFIAKDAPRSRRGVPCGLCESPHRALLERGHARGMQLASLRRLWQAKEPDREIGKAAVENHFRRGHHAR